MKFLSGDRVTHEKYGDGVVVNERSGYVNVHFDRGYDQKFLNEGSLGKILRKLTGRGEGMSPTSKGAKKGLAKKVDREADDKFSSAFNLRYPSGINRYTAALNDITYGPTHRQDYADTLGAKGQKLRARAHTMRKNAMSKNK